MTREAEGKVVRTQPLLHIETVTVRMPVVRFTGTVQEFYALAPRDTASGRVADGAYTAVLGGGEAW